MLSPAVLIVDDNPLVTEALRIQLARRGLRCAGSLDRADRLSSSVRETHADVVLLDLDMPGQDPFEALGELLDETPRVKVLVLTGLIDREMVDLAFERGASGYLSKNDSSEVIASAILRALDGEFVISPGVEEVCWLSVQ